MDAEKFDYLSRKLGSSKTRRHALAALAAIPALWMQRGRAAQLGPPSCGTAGKVCTMLAGCCEGLTCVTSAINTNYGVCVSGGDGGTVASGTSLVSPFTESAQATGTVDSPTSTSTTTSTGTTTTGTSTTTTTDPKAERQAKLQERRSRRSTRRNKIQSRRNTKATSRKTRREDANEAEVLAAGPVLELSVLDQSTPERGPYELLVVTNKSRSTVLLTKIVTLLDASEGMELDNSLSFGSSVKLLAGVPNDVKLSSGEEFWNTRDVCHQNPADGYVLSASFSADLENHEFVIHCDGSVEGLTSAADDGTSNNRKKRKRKQQAAARRKKRKQNKKDHSNR